ncbi:MAG: 2Fe-2S iron-sulfur cluster binding domain-containing protein [Tenericutes bacterium]|nr:2Fe-2S iron-sulfur cluster binding domain-containing protein [Mycoplasmatota bacterium]
MKIKMTVNNQVKIFECEPSDYLLDTLRNNNYVSVRRGCDTTNCGVCTVLMDGKPVPSCSVLTVQAEGKQITTVEGIQEEAEKIGNYFGEEGADQCGYCNPSLALTVYAMKKELVNPTIKEVKKYLVGNLCRCTGYISQERAIMKYLGDKS